MVSLSTANFGSKDLWQRKFCCISRDKTPLHTQRTTVTENYCDAAMIIIKYLINGAMYKMRKTVIETPSETHKSNRLPGKIRHFNEQMSLSNKDSRDGLVLQDRHVLHH